MHCEILEVRGQQGQVLGRQSHLNTIREVDSVWGRPEFGVFILVGVCVLTLALSSFE